MNDLLGKILVGVSLAVTIALAVPLSLMTATVIRGESPRQLARNAKPVYTVDTDGTKDKAGQADAQPESEDDSAEPVKPMTVGEQFGVKPQVPPDPQLDTSPESEIEVTPEPAAEPDPEPEPAPAPRTTKKTTVSQKPNTTANKGTSTTKSIPAEAEPVQAKQEPEPVPQKAAPADPEPEPVYEIDPNYVPSMVEGMNDPEYIQYLQQTQTVAQQTEDSQYTPSIFGDSMENYEATGSQMATPSITPDNEEETNSSPAPSSDGSWGESSTTNEVTGDLNRAAYWTSGGKSYHFSKNCPSLSRSTNILEGTLQDALNAGKTDPCNNCAGGS